MKNEITYEILWCRLSLFKSEKTDDYCSTSRIFTLWPPWIWEWLTIPDPWKPCYDWLKQNGHWDDKNFIRAVCWWWANHSDPGSLVRLNSKLLR